VESAAGVSEGARTGLHSVFVGLLFLLAIFLAPLAGVIPAAATAPALILIGFLMISQIAKIDFEKMENAIPAFLTFAMLPLTYSISHGVGYGFISYAVIHLLNGKWRDVHPLMWGICGIFVAYFIWGTV
jgi:AGZA family xanthine/uracil permease-like MFS transporter